MWETSSLQIKISILCSLFAFSVDEKGYKSSILLAYKYFMFPYIYMLSMNIAPKDRSGETILPDGMKVFDGDRSSDGWPVK